MSSKELIELLLELSNKKSKQSWMNLDKTEHSRLILQLAQMSKAELIQYFQG
jgi:hypothetical protein